MPADSGRPALERPRQEAEDQEGDGGGRDADPDHDREGDVPLAGSGRAGVVDELVATDDAGDAAGRPGGGDQDRLDRPRPRDERVERERPDDGGAQSAARRGEIQDGAEHRKRGERDGADRQRRSRDRQAQQERHGERGEDRQAVPVAERITEPGEIEAEAEQVLGRDQVGKQRLKNASPATATIPSAKPSVQSGIKPRRTASAASAKTPT